jgi:hypothetical protein
MTHDDKFLALSYFMDGLNGREKEEEREKFAMMLLLERPIQFRDITHPFMKRKNKPGPSRATLRRR